MPISFPASPTTNQTYTYGNRTYRWTGTAWEFVSSGGSGLTWSSVPASATATGTAGQIAYDGGNLWVCVATNQWMRAQLSTGPIYKAFDSFTAADGTAISGRLLETGTANPTTWSAALSGPNAANGVIRNNTFQADNYAGSPNSGNNNYSFATVNSGSSNVTITTTVVIGSRDYEYAYCGIAARFTDINNNIRVFLFRNGNVDVGTAMVLRQVSGGTTTQLGSSVGTGTSLTAGTAYTLTLVLSGTSITATLSNGLSVSGTSSVNQTATTHGVFIGHTGDNGSGSVTSFDNFAVT